MFGQVSELYRTGKSIKHINKATSDEQAKRFVKHQSHGVTVETNTTECWLKQSLTYRCKSVVERFLSLDLEDKDLDLQRFMKEELLPFADELPNHS